MYVHQIYGLISRLRGKSDRLIASYFVSNQFECYIRLYIKTQSIDLDASAGSGDRRGWKVIN